MILAIINHLCLLVCEDIYRLSKIMKDELVYVDLMGFRELQIAAKP
jgi:hypothetical protein